MISPTAIVVVPLTFALGYHQLVRHRAKVAQQQMQLVLVTAIDRMMLDLRSGLSLAQACGALAEQPNQHGALMSLAAELRSRHTLLEAATAMASSQAARRDPSIRIVAVTLEMLALNGGPALPAMRRLRHTLMGLVHSEQQAAAESSQALASAALMCTAPALFVVAMVTLDPRLAAFYLHESLGTACVVVASLLAYGGWRWMERIVAAGPATGPSW